MSHQLVLNIDVAPTLAAAAGVPAPGVEGRNLLRLLADPSAPWRDKFLILGFSGGTVLDVDGGMGSLRLPR